LGLDIRVPISGPAFCRRPHRPKAVSVEGEGIDADLGALGHVDHSVADRQSGHGAQGRRALLAQDGIEGSVRVVDRHAGRAWIQHRDATVPEELDVGDDLEKDLRAFAPLPLCGTPDDEALLESPVL